MLRLSKLTDYGTVVLSQMAQQPARQHTTAELAARSHLAATTVSKLLKLFAKAGLVNSHRGAHGGYTLARSPDSISAVQIIDAIEGPVAITQCSLSHNQCGIESVCGIGHNWQRISLSIRDALKTVSLTQLARPAALPPRLDFGRVLDSAPQGRKQ
jgi:FeS assembly SUF system regulator